ncbi:MAG: hypothetical protein K6G38_02030 [Gammaproteobacteria bacterium]|nr:hypothetical protein [Gammaproteobacteria bacterium]
MEYKHALRKEVNEAMDWCLESILNNLSKDELVKELKSLLKYVIGLPDFMDEMMEK